MDTRNDLRARASDRPLASGVDFVVVSGVS